MDWSETLGWLRDHSNAEVADDPQATKSGLVEAAVLAFLDNRLEEPKA